MGENRVVQGRMVNATRLAEIIEGESVMETTNITDAEFECPSCNGPVLEVGYMPTVSEFITGHKCQECDWKETDRQ